jgi:hypothetical protein
MEKLIFMMIVVSMVFVVPNAMAYKEGDLELTLGGSGSSDESLEGSVLNIEAGLGYFMTQNSEAIWRQGISFADMPGDDNWSGSTRLAFNYNFDMWRWYPYLGANIGYLYGDTVKEQFIAGPEAGVKYFVNHTTYIVGGIEYQFFFTDAGEADKNFSDGRFVYILAIGFQF